MSNKSPVSVEEVSDEVLKDHLAGSWVELKIENWKEEGCIALANVGLEDPTKLWNDIKHVLGGRYGEKSVHPKILKTEGEECLFVVINEKDYDDGRTPLAQQIMKKTRAIDLEFLEEPAVGKALVKCENQFNKWFSI
ncbi:hypothetical protein MAA_11133 [Metarhizium robertsii ARSEF 23]|uniref:Uncharacterized protein n=1 Tax=Metarhizium robertsii (strain ARSEF 23 / ATCC MYA-3075) TaxID=655844 RepID=A0A0B2X8V2_METRA|nr:uncharacterized protein MAA_11133 [Metarhizium robertsii ARSEF 23]KHO11318.1 hypothetical protein MAA_11133 [Metarhizium robertsii ARSEF 23]